VKSAPRFASLAPFCRLICDHLLWPDIAAPVRDLCGPDSTKGYADDRQRHLARGAVMHH